MLLGVRTAVQSGGEYIRCHRQPQSVFCAASASCHGCNQSTKYHQIRRILHARQNAYHNPANLIGFGEFFATHAYKWRSVIRAGRSPTQDDMHVRITLHDILDSAPLSLSQTNVKHYIPPSQRYHITPPCPRSRNNAPSARRGTRPLRYRYFRPSNF